MLNAGTIPGLTPGGMRNNTWEIALRYDMDDVVEAGDLEAYFISFM